MPLWNASPKASGYGTAKAPRTSWRPPAGLCPPIQRRRPAHLGLRGEAAGAPQNLERLETNWCARRRCQCSQRAPGFQGQGAHSGPGATCSARAVRAEARAKPAGRGCAPARHDLPAPQLPGAPRPPGGGSGQCRVRAVLDREHQEGCSRQVPRGPSPEGVRAASSSRAAQACLCWRQCAALDGKLQGSGVPAAALPAGLVGGAA